MDPLNWWCVHVIGNITLSGCGATNTPQRTTLKHCESGSLGWTWDICWGWIRYILYILIQKYTTYISEMAVSSLPNFAASSHANKHAPLWVRLQQLSQSRWSGDLQGPLGGSRCGDRWLSHIITKCHQCYPVILLLYERPRACTAHTPCKGWLTLATCPLRLFSASLEQKPVCTIMNQWFHSNMHSLIAWSLCLWHVFALAWLSWHVTTELVVDRWWKV